MRELDLHEKPGDKKITIYFRGEPYEAYKGETIAVALLANGVRRITTSGKGRKRGAFYFGPCPVEVDGVKNTDGRRTKVKDGMRIEMQNYLDLDENAAPGSGEVQRLVVDVAVVGAGPAGLGAALSLQEKATVALIEDKGYLGGAMYNISRSVDGFGVPGREAANALASQLDPSSVTVMKGTAMLGVFPEGEYYLVSAARGKTLYEIMAKYVVLATGSVDNIMLFENNEYPGVFRRDFALDVINRWGVAPGRKVAVVGSRPDDVVPELESHGIEYIVLDDVKRVDGGEHVEFLIDRNGERHDVDAVIVSDGRRPDTNPVTQAGGRIEFRNGYYAPVYNDSWEVRDRIYVAGSAAEMRGYRGSYLHGAAVGNIILSRMGLESDNNALDELDRWPAEEVPVRDVPLDIDLEETFICGCDVTLGSVKSVMDRGITSLQIIKRLTHLGMGFCQGRYCIFNGAVAVSQVSGREMERISMPSARPPIKNVDMGTTARRD